jgi:hypothetical protein
MPAVNPAPRPSELSECCRRDHCELNKSTRNVENVNVVYAHQQDVRSSISGPQLRSRLVGLFARDVFPFPFVFVFVFVFTFVCALSHMSPVVFIVRGDHHTRLHAHAHTHALALTHIYMTAQLLQLFTCRRAPNCAPVIAALFRSLFTCCGVYYITPFLANSQPQCFLPKLRL